VFDMTVQNFLLQVLAVACGVFLGMWAFAALV
jgi:hypothetical protein